MTEFGLKYGCNPGQKPARVFMEEGELPFEILNGRPGYINFLDALNSWQLVRELSTLTGLPAAASFKHVSPAGAALGLPLSETDRRVFFTEGLEMSPLSSAYAAARGADRLSSYGDWAALSEECDEATALFLKREVSDGVIAPGYSPKALEILRSKRKGTYAIVKMDPAYVPETEERRQIFGVTFEQRRNDMEITPALLENVVTRKKEFTQGERRDLLCALVTLKYTQSNSVCCFEGGRAIGVGAGQQSRIHCTRLAGNKADLWHLRRHPAVLELPFLPDTPRPARDNAIDVYLGPDRDDVLRDGVWQTLFSRRPKPLPEAEKRDWLGRVTGVSIGSDAFFPFGDNIERAARSGVTAVVEPGGSVRDGDVIAAADRLGMTVAFCGARFFHH